MEGNLILREKSNICCLGPINFQVFLNLQVRGVQQRVISVSQELWESISARDNVLASVQHSILKLGTLPKTYSHKLY